VTLCGLAVIVTCGWSQNSLTVVDYRAKFAGFSPACFSVYCKLRTFFPSLDVVPIPHPRSGSHLWSFDPGIFYPSYGGSSC